MMSNRLMTNYGWVQNTSNLSTIRDTIDLVPDPGIRHLELRNEIKVFRELSGNLPKGWTWDARCRIKAIHALGLVTLDRHIQGYELTELGKELKRCPKSSNIGRRNCRELTNDEREIFKRGLLTNPPVIRVLDLLNKDRRGENVGLSKYDIGMQLGFVGDVGFTHIDPYWVVREGFTFNNKEGDADKWARTILSWLEQVGWVTSHANNPKLIHGKRLKIYGVTNEVERVLRYNINSTPRHVPSEMLCSGHHSFPELVQKKRIVILRFIETQPRTLAEIKEEVNSKGMHATEELMEFELINLINAGFRIEHSGGCYKLKDRIVVDDKTIQVREPEQSNAIDSLIEEMVVKYERTIPVRLIDHLIRYGYDGTKGSKFEGIVAEYFRFIGYDTDYLGQGRGRVTDILAKWKHPTIYAHSYAIIIDAKATGDRYNFPVGDKRKMAEYVRTHGAKLLEEQIPNHAFSFVSSDFVDSINEHIEEIRQQTGIDGCAIPILILLDFGDRITKQELTIDGVYEKFTTNEIFDLN